MNNVVQHFKSGFTMIELVITIGLIGILTSIAVGVLDPVGQIQKGKDAKRKSDLSQIQRALETHYHDFGYYPKSCGTNQIELGATCLTWGVSAFGSYMPKLPKDEDSTRRYVYVATGTNPQAFYLYTSLQRGAKDPQACSGGLACSGVPPSTYCDVNNTNNTRVCNYGLSSPNTSP